MAQQAQVCDRGTETFNGYGMNNNQFVGERIHDGSDQKEHQESVVMTLSGMDRSFGATSLFDLDYSPAEPAHIEDYFQITMGMEDESNYSEPYMEVLAKDIIKDLEAEVMTNAIIGSSEEEKEEKEEKEVIEIDETKEIAQKVEVTKFYIELEESKVLKSNKSKSKLYKMNVSWFR